MAREHFAKEDLRILVNNLNTNKQHAFAGKDSNALDCASSSEASRSRELIVLFGVSETTS